MSIFIVREGLGVKIDLLKNGRRKHPVERESLSIIAKKRRSSTDMEPVRGDRKCLLIAALTYRIVTHPDLIFYLSLLFNSISNFSVFNFI